MDTDQIIGQIEKFQAQLLKNTGNGVEVNDPGPLSDAIVKIRILLVQLVEKVAEAELDYRHSKSSAFDALIQEGTKRSPAFDLLDMDKALIDKKIATERIRNYMKYVDGLVSAVQSLLKVQSSADKNQY